jgi:predicted acylesterase/phospholipase RssA
MVSPRKTPAQPMSADDVSASVIEPAEDVSLPARDPALALQRMEAALVRADLVHPNVLTPEEFRRLRYLISFARLDVFEPGAAGPGGGRGRGDVSVGPELAGFRGRVIDALHDALRKEHDLERRLIGAKEALVGVADLVDEQRKNLAEQHANEFSLAELDSELGYKSLVCVLGGGGGAGYVYIGAMQKMVEHNMIPSYLIGSSFGAIVSAIMARTLPIPIEEYIAWAKTVTYAGILGPETLRRRHGLPGLFSLRFDTIADGLFRCADGQRMRMQDLAIPCETVVAGVLRQSFDRLPRRFRGAEMAALQLRTLPFLRIGIGPVVAARLWQIAAFVDRRVVKPILFGGDQLTEAINVVDAVAFSCAIPGVLHHESNDPAMYPLLDEVMRIKDVAALVDGSAASNVPVELAWKRVQDGRLGTRNACYFAWDCFHPQWDPKHLWLQPLTQALHIQMVRNAPFADRIVQFSPTLSPVTLAASEAAIDRAMGWGSASVAPALPMIQRLMEPVWWEGDGPPVVERASAPSAKATARPMSSIIAAARSATGRISRRRRITQAKTAGPATFRKRRRSDSPEKLR